ncbi:hypothetical protein SAY87_014379 [Trapa incisa]|uniref:TF-B3 domain-containing protein n=1 Tax=Trapa incisa TaxID=236973 RepID=A0AAN7GMY1_9MYRT|nr:hypothetical protein SAY87_014379 [Trapa incisa]
MSGSILWNKMEDEQLSDALDTVSPFWATHDSMKKQDVNANGIRDQFTFSRSLNSEALQSLYNGDMHPVSKNVDHQHLGVQPNAQGLLYSDGMKLMISGDEVKEQPECEEEQKPKKPRRKKRKIDASELGSSQPDNKSETRTRFYSCSSTRKRTLTAEEREKALNEAKMFVPQNPFCRVVLRPSYLYRGCMMYLPSCFAEKHLNGVSGFIKLQRSDGNQWSVRCLYREGKAKLGRGWYDFSLENNLAEGDVCIFELIPAREVILKVTAFPAIDDAAC